MVKLPVKSIAPPTLTSAGKAILVRMVSWAICSVPPTDFRPGIDISVNAALETIAKLPAALPRLPTEINLGAEREENELP